MPQQSSLITPVILCGGKGTRLWPLSRASWPKQFLQLTGSLSLFQQTLERVSDHERFAPPLVVTNQEYRFIVAEQAQEAGVKPAAVLLEPMARNTAPAIAAAAEFALEKLTSQQDPILFLMPSDHELTDDDSFRASVDAAANAARQNYLATFGVRPSEPATGFGYIEAGPERSHGTRAVTRFVEKPDRETAERMLSEGTYLWNSGMFVFSARAFLEECRLHAPEVLAAAQDAVKSAREDLDFVRLDADAFAAAPDISIDYAIFERTKKAVVVPADITWSDLGSWDAVWKALARDTAGNALKGPVSVSNTQSSLVFSEGIHLCVDSLDDVAVIASPDAVYVGRLSGAQNVGKLVKLLRESNDTRALTETHLTNYRPWGGYSSVLQGERFQVKRLFVKPGKRLSLQQHHHRAEHWVVVRGTAEVTVGDSVRTLSENKSVYVPLGAVHRLANPGKILLELIEVQTGSYLGEDDIIRLEDEFGRSRTD